MKILATGGQILAGRVGQAAVVAVTSIVVARSLGPVGQGHFSLTLLVITLLAALLNGGMGLAAVPRLRRGEVSLARMLRAQSAWIVLAALVALGLILAGSRTGLGALASERLGWDSVVAAASVVGIVALLAFDIFFYDLLAEGRLVVGPLINLGRVVLNLLVLGGLILWSSLSLGGAVVAYAVAQVCAVLAVALLLHRRSRQPAGLVAAAPPLPRLVAGNLRRGWIGQFSAVASLLHLRLDQALVSVFWGAAVVGIYSVAVQVGELLWLLAGALSPLLVYSSAAQADGPERDRQAARAVRIGLGATALVALPLGLVARPLLTFLFGADFAAAAPALQALLPGIVAFAPGAVLAGDFIGRGRPAWNAQASAFTVLVNIAAGLLLIPRLGAVGASWASTLAYIAGAGLMISRFRRVSGLPLAEILMPRISDYRP